MLDMTYIRVFILKLETSLCVKNHNCWYVNQNYIMYALGNNVVLDLPGRKITLFKIIHSIYYNIRRIPDVKKASFER